MEIDAHGSQVARHQDPAIFRRDPQDFQIESALRDYARSRLKVYSTALFEAVLSVCRDRCRRQLESGSSSEPGVRFFPGPLKTVDHFLRHGISRLDLFEDAVLIFQVGFHLSRVLQ